MYLEYHTYGTLHMKGNVQGTDRNITLTEHLFMGTDMFIIYKVNFNFDEDTTDCSLLSYSFCS